MMMALTYYSIISLLFLMMLVFSGRIREALEPWFGPEGLNRQKLMFFIFSGLIIASACASGIVLMLKKHRAGFYIYLAAAILLLGTDLLLLEFDWMRYLVNSGFIFILGLVHFSGRCYGKQKRKKEKQEIHLSKKY